MPLKNVFVEEYSQVDQFDEETAPIQRVARKDAEVVYPDSDGEPMGETGFHVHATLHLYGALLNFFCHAADVYVVADMFLYYEEGNPRACKAPDVMVIKGVDKHERRTFKTWEEQAVPCVIFEMTSKSTMVEDLVVKSILYASLGIREYFVFDPLHEYLENQLIGFCLEGKEYIPIQPTNGSSLFSKELRLILTPEEDILRLIEPDTGKPVPDYVESLAIAQQEAQRAEQETQRAEQERKRAEVAEAELARLRAMINTR
jgi:Uma2 family endonuclease